MNEINSYNAIYISHIHPDHCSDDTLKLINKKSIYKKNVIDTLELARSKHPGAQNSLDALCKRYNIDNSKREKHTALIDCHLLKEVYINLLDQKEPKLNLENKDSFDPKPKNINIKGTNVLRKILKISEDELKLHKSYLKTSLEKNYYK